MRTAKPPASEGAASSSRRQPVRQTRVNPPRTSSLNRANSLGNAPVAEQPIDILPGVTHFTDAITALPKELVRHFTLLKEVDAKIFAPEAALLQLLHSAVNTPALDFAKPLNDASSSIASVSAPVSAHNSTTGPANPPAPSSDGAASSVFDPANIPRRTIFRDTALKIQEMLVSLEEKNHVIATANDALQKQLSRIEDVWPHLEGEFSEEAKWGSATHWAYVENRQAKASDKQAERSRREGAATLSAAAQALAEEAAARSSDRKQAMAAKKSAKNQAAEAEGEKAPDAGKKAPGGKSRKPLPDSGPVGLGITPGPPGTAPTSKRRKVEAKPNGGTPTERAMGSVFGTNAAKQRTTSPRETPAPESGNKKRKALPSSSGQAKKSRTTAAMSPSVTSSPVIGSFPDPVRPGRGSPAPSVTAPRPASSRARQNSTQSSVENARHHLPSAASSKTNVNPQGTPDPGQASNGARTNTDAKTQEATVPIMNKPSSLKPETEEPQPVPEPAQHSSKKEAATKPSDEPVPTNKETAPLAIQPASVAMVKTKSGRASKPSTPATATFAEAASSTAGPTTARSRPSRNNNNNNNAESTTGTAGTGPSSNATTTAAPTTKRSHKKGASISATAAAHAHQHAAAASTTSGPTTSTKEKEKEKDKDKDSAPAAGNSVSVGGSGGGSSSTKRDSGKAAAAANAKGGSGSGAAAVAADNDDDDDDQEVADEDLYCYCNQVSYGEMVACDGDGCPREWFHLECVGLKVAPKVNAKWYCEDCKKRLKIAERR